MSATLDANVLLYAVNRDAAKHERARDLVEELGQGPGLLYLFWPTIMGFLRIATHPAVLPAPLAPAQAIEVVSSLIDRSNVLLPDEGTGFWSAYVHIHELASSRGNDVPDAHLAALMILSGVRRIYTRDRDFRRFDSTEAIDPFE